MNEILIFLCAISAIILGAITINKIKGVKAQYLDAFTAEPGEEVLHREAGADFHMVTRLGRAQVMSFARLRRAELIVTNRRIVIGQKVMFGKRYMITHTIWLEAAANVQTELDKMTGGQYSLGYVNYLVKRSAATAEIDGKKPYVKFVPEPTASATNIEHLRVYVDAPEKLLGAIAGK
ncbi:hypothetical protein [Turneriella parva]|uniref:Uncharacterized protein n=1 Tax=Turneriella parva (strain ATCC BAA-1111 / DSM 21527 / NCTC 11395 / H) TaxID=869212 RepID=I4B4X6_TURPD|nr:hypothetical protein [Turneriella parva]AFM12333.1 hypothetical protein Turpa_1685 [Turneriella parva DSM 21527]